MRTEVRREIEQNAGELGKHGTNQYTTGGDMSPPDEKKRGSNGRDYTIARLKRDRPDLAQQVIDGEISAAEGRRRAGYEVKKIAIRLDDPQSAAQTIMKHMDPEAIEELIELLRQEIRC